MDEYLDIIGRLYPDKLMQILEQPEPVQLEQLQQQRGISYWINLAALALVNLIIITILSV